MSKIKLNLIAAASKNMGIGINGTLPWRLKKEMAYFATMTTKVLDNQKKNAVIMGRVTWDCLPLKYKPLKDRINIVITRNVDKIKSEVTDGVVIVDNLDAAISHIENREDIENVWVIGGSSIYKQAMEHPSCSRVYLTEIQSSFECDTFFPQLDMDQFRTITVDGVANDKQVEGEIEYYFKVYEKINVKV